MKRFPLVLISTLTLLTACGGDGSTDVAEGGMGGTGISQGPVTGFGSVYVNGVKYETDSAVFERDGSEMFVQNDFALGEYVTVEGTVNADGVTGTASKVSYSTLLEGPVSAVDLDTEIITVLGQAIHLDALTVRIGFSFLDELQLGNMLEVSGVHSGASAISATAIVKKSEVFISGESELEFKGTVSSVDVAASQFTVNGFVIDYSASGFPATAPETGMAVEVEATESPVDNVIAASKIELESAVSYDDGTELELQGTVTTFTSQQDFEVNGIPVTTHASTEFEDGLASLLALNVRVEVEGRFTGGVLSADEVSIREAQSSIKREGTVSSIDAANQTFVLLGKTIVVDSATMLIDEDLDKNFSLGDLQAGEIVEVYGNELSNGSIRASKVEREEGDEELEWEGIVESLDSAAFSLILTGDTVTTDENTEFEAKGDIGRGAFFALLKAGETKIKVEGSVTGDNILLASKIEIDD